MKKVGVGDMATRRSYGQDLVFYVRRILGTDPPVAQLIGVNVRLFADSPLDDLIVLDYRVKPSSPSGLKAIIARVVFERAKPKPQRNYRLEAVRADYVPIPGKSASHRRRRALPQAMPDFIPESQCPCDRAAYSGSGTAQEDQGGIGKHRPDILVITGHDGLLRKQGSRDFLINYRSSQYFVETVKQARLYDTNRDGLAIIAGACQSHFESLIEAGANFASAPERVMIHCYDPVFVAEKLAYTPFTQVVDLPELFYTTISGKDGIGGIETRGKLRQGFPRLESWLPTESYT